jgi:hypothetical protein
MVSPSRLLLQILISGWNAGLKNRHRQPTKARSMPVRVTLDIPAVPALGASAGQSGNHASVFYSRIFSTRLENILENGSVARAQTVIKAVISGLISYNGWTNSGTA